MLVSSLVPASGCCCSGLELFPDECTSAAECPDDGLLCNGVAECSGLLGRSCGTAPLACGPDRACVERFGCVSCTDAPDHPSCRAEAVDAGAPTPTPTCPSDEPSDDRDDCLREQRSTHASTGADGFAGRDLEITSFRGGSCAATCDPSAADACGACGQCETTFLAGATHLPLFSSDVPSDPWLDSVLAPAPIIMGVCRARCTPSNVDRGCERDGLACNVETGACTEACVSDAQCQIRAEDADGDGDVELVDHGPRSGAYCDEGTGRCRSLGSALTRAYDPCVIDRDCPDDHTCVRLPGAMSSFCARTGCRTRPTLCEPGSHCDGTNAGVITSVCLRDCVVGRDSDECPAGWRCVWDETALGGSCVPGVWSDVAEPNVGAACTSDAECASPLGHGVCLFRGERAGATGICSVRECAQILVAGSLSGAVYPGVVVDDRMCDPSLGLTCVDLARADSPAPRPHCLPTCTDASTCAPGYACAIPEDAVERVCWPRCRADDECRAGERCASASGETCAAGDPQCHCIAGATP